MAASALDDAIDDLVWEMAASAVDLAGGFPSPIDQYKKQVVNDSTIFIANALVLTLYLTPAAWARLAGLLITSFGITSAVIEHTPRLQELSDDVDIAALVLDDQRNMNVDDCTPEQLEGVWRTALWPDPGGTADYLDPGSACKRQWREFNHYSPFAGITDHEFWFIKNCDWPPPGILPSIVSYECPDLYFRSDALRLCTLEPA